jgi:hypothetical protein
VANARERAKCGTRDSVAATGCSNPVTLFNIHSVSLAPKKALYQFCEQTTKIAPLFGGN